MKILVTLTYYHPHWTGLTAYAKRLAVGLAARGHRLTAIGGSDNHDATDTTGAKQSPIGKPATVALAHCCPLQSRRNHARIAAGSRTPDR